MQKDIKTKLKVGIDAKWYFEGPASGKMVIRNLVNELSKLNSEEFEFYFLLNKKHISRRLEFENIDTKKIHIWSGNNLFSNVFVIPYYARKHKLDIVLYQTSVSFLGRHKKIAYIHDLIFITHPQFYTFWEKLYFSPIKFLTKYSDFVITVSDFEKKRFEDLKFTTKKIEVLHHGVDPIFKPLKEFNFSNVENVKKKYALPDEYILYVGRINKRKNVPNLISGFSQLKNREVKLVLVGNKEWKTDNIEEIVEKNGISKRVVFTGPLSGEELAILYASAKVFCFPSFEESFGLPPLEAMSSGLPVVVSDSSSIPEVCGGAGIFVNAKKPLEIIEAIEDLLENDDKRQKQIEKSLLRAKEFSWEKTTKKLISILNDRYGV
jgi:glycosyltransferase involved in cell wall biosynthesis